MKQLTKVEAIAILQKAQNHIPHLNRLNLELTPFGLRNLQLAVCPQEFFEWHRDTSLALDQIFGENFRCTQEFRDITKLINPTPLNPSVHLPDAVSERTADYLRMLDRADSLLSSLLKYIEDFWANEQAAATAVKNQVTNDPINNDVFVVHGRDEGAKNTVVLFLEKLGLHPIVLADQPGQGLTIIEKFQQHAEVNYAVVLLTPDDTGALLGAREQSPRARQNVIFELGFFIGKLGRHKVCVLTKCEPEIPSDYAGVEYITLDGDVSWDVRLFRELQAAGFRVDANRAFGI